MEKLASCIVREGPLGTEDAVGWVYRLATTLELLHGVGRAHGRISAKAIDLLARPCDSAGFFLDAYELPEDPCYQSPERLAGGGPTPRDDVWAIGVLLFFALTGQLPFPGPSAIEVSGALVAGEPPSLAALGIDDPKIQRMIDQLLALDPSERLCSLHPLRSVLVEWYEFLTRLPALKLGKPSLALFDEPTDDEGQKLTEVLHSDPAILQARLEHARRKVEARAAETAVSPSADAAFGPPSADAASGPPSADAASGPPSADAASGPPSADAAFGPPSADAASGPPSSKELASTRLSASQPQSDPSPSARSGEASAEAAEVGRRAAEGADATPQPPHPTADDPPEPFRGDLSVVDLPVVDGRKGPQPLPSPEPAAPAMPTDPDPGPSAASSPAPPHRLGGWALLFALFCVVAGGAGAYVLLAERPKAGTPSIPTSPTPTGTATATTPSTGATADTAVQLPVGSSAAPNGTGELSKPPQAERPETTTPTDAGAARGDAAAAPRVNDAGAALETTAELAACVAGLFAPDAWNPRDPPDLRFVCSERNTIKGARRLHVVLTAAGRGRPTATRAMHEWALLTWYDKAVFALAHGHCCANALPLDTKPTSESCAFDATITSLLDAASSANPEALEAGRVGFHNAAACLLRNGLASAYGERSMPAPGSFTIFKRIAERAESTPRR